MKCNLTIVTLFLALLRKAGFRRFSSVSAGLSLTVPTLTSHFSSILVHWKPLLACTLKHLSWYPTRVRQLDLEQSRDIMLPPIPYDSSVKSGDYFKIPSDVLHNYIDKPSRSNSESIASITGFLSDESEMTALSRASAICASRRRLN